MVQPAIEEPNIVTISDHIRPYVYNGRLTAGYKVVLNETPVFVGTFGECAEWGTANMERGANWMVRDARGLQVA